MNHEKGLYFDLHLHASLKHFLTLNKKGKRRSIWKKITHWTSPIARLAPILRSQGCLSQLQAGNVQMAVVGICPLELPLAKFVRKNALVTLITPVKKRILNNIIFNPDQQHSPFQLLTKELSFLVNECKHGGANIMSNFEDLKKDKVNILLSIEGGHALMGNQNGNKMGNENEEDTILDNLLRIKKSPHRFLYLTLTHLTQNPLANHAFALKKVLGKSLNDPAFKPNGNGLTSLGKEVIHLAYDTSAGRQVLIDIKHMSLKSRLEFYKFREKNGYTDVPIIASHVAMSGFSISELRKNVDIQSSEIMGEDVVLHYQPVQGKCGVSFNPWSINLYDEEIPYIIQSGGLIGLCMDERILGRTKLEPEYFSREEFRSCAPNLYEQILHKNSYPNIPSEQKSKKRTGSDSKNRHIKYLCNNILHMVKAGGPKAWKHICLGSDFDGFISPIQDCKSTLGFESLEKGPRPDTAKNEQTIAQVLQEMAAEDPLCDTIPNIEEKVRDIMYNNAYAFLQKHLVQ